MTCTETRDLLSEYIDDDLGAAARAHIEAHLATCDDCRARHRALRRTVRFVQAHADALPDGTPLGAAYARFSRALVDDASAATPEQILVEALGASMPESTELTEGEAHRPTAQEEAR